MRRRYGKASWLFAALLALALTGQAAAETPRETADTLLAQARAAMQTDPKRAQIEARDAQPVIARIADPATRGELQATALWLEGEASFRLDDAATAAPLLRTALPLVRRYAPGTQLEGNVLISSGGVHGDQGQVLAALTDYQNAHAIFLKINDPRNRAIALVDIATLYTKGKDFESALKYLGQALAAYQGDPALEGAIHDNRASALRQLGRYDEAERGYEDALRVARRMRSPVLEAQVLRNIARTQLQKGDLDAAERTIARGRAVARLADGGNSSMMLSVAAWAAFQRGDLHDARSLIERSFDGVDPTTTTLTFREAHETAYRVYRALHLTDRALVHLTAMKRIDDQVTRVATTTGAALMAARFDFANQELRIARLKADDLERRVEAEHQRAQVQRYIVYGGAGMAAVVISALLFGLVTLRRSRDKVRAANDDLALANTALGKALAAKTEFLATTSHEIRTPLNGILGMTQVMLADGSLPEATRERLTVVQAAGTTMRTLVDDILDVAKMENGKLVLECAPFDLRTTIVDATRLWDTQAASKGIAFRRDLDACPSLVAGDVARVRQVVFNLLSNALKFTDAGEIAISAEQQDDGRVAIAVSDSGIGIPAEKLEAIFESFRQADAGTTRRFGGTGLGLAICRQLARAMGGDVRVESRVGEGSVFTVTLPLAPAVPEGAQVGGVADAALLVVERNPIARSLLRTLLAPHAERIVFADSAATALAAMRDDRVSRVLVDEATLATAGDTVAALATIAAAAKGGATVTLLAQPAEAEQQEALLATGIDGILPKPVSGPQLVATLFRQENDPLVRRAA